MELIDKIQWAAILLLGIMVFIQSNKAAHHERVLSAISIILISEFGSEDIKYDEKGEL